MQLVFNWIREGIYVYGWMVALIVQASEFASDRVALIRKGPLVVEEDVDLEGGRGDGSGSSPPPWIDDLLDIRYNCTLITQKMKELDTLQNKHVQRPTFDDDTSTELQIEEATETITRVWLIELDCLGHEVLRISKKLIM